ncbi:MAG: putative LPS assembly protein LptD [Acidobacteria bacterium]|nr:putative LPS assembly protein LptD [Acidobacteriota bacterium]MDW7984232.1 putative LPS assembly protein LptD [Acidobacteriota bacterium]
MNRGLRTWVTAVGFGAVLLGVTAVGEAAEAQCQARASTQRIEANTLELEGWVTLTCADVTVQAAYVRIDRKTQILVAEGDVTVVQGETRLTGERLELDLQTRTGTMYQAFAFDTPHIFGTAREVYRAGEDTYRMRSAEVTECRYRSPHWSLHAERVQLKLDDYVRFTHVVVKVKSVPILYLPMLQIPIKRERTTGFLFPRFGPNNQKGFFFEQAFFWAISRSQDLTLAGRWFSQRGLGLNAEYRYVLSTQSSGQADWDLFRDDLLGTQWQVRWNHMARWGLWAWVVSADWFSSYSFIQTFGGDFARRTQVQRFARTYLTTRWGVAQLYVQADVQSVALGDGQTVFLGRLPTAQASIYNYRLGPAVMALDASYNFLYRRQADRLQAFHRLDAFPRWSLPWNRLPWLSVTPTVALRGTLDSHRQAPAGDALETRPLARGQVAFNVQAIGPVLYRIYDVSPSFRLKHTVEPFVQYDWSHTYRPAGVSPPLFDPGDFTLGQHQVTYGLNHRFFVRRRSPDGPSSPREWFSWSLAHSFQLPGSSLIQPGVPKAGSVQSLWRFTPSDTLSLDAGLLVHPRGWKVTQWSVSGLWRFSEQAAFSVAWLYQRGLFFQDFTPVTTPASQQVRFSLTTPPGRVLQLQVSGAYDVTRRQWYNAVGGIIWNQDCFSLGVQVVRYQLGLRPELQFHFSLSIPKVGNLLHFVPGLGGSYF